jgi:Tfp pilus assembly protein PilO
MTKTRQWSVFTAVAVIVVLLAGWFLLVKPQSSKTSSLKAQAASQEQSNQLLQTTIAQLQTEERQLPQQQQALQKFATQVPSDAAEPTVIRQLSAAAAGAGVDLVSMTPGAATLVTTSGTVPGSSTLSTAPTTSGQLLQLPLTLGITGTYPNVESFFQSLEKLPRALLVTGWSLCPDGGPAALAGGGSISCSAPSTPSNKTLPPNAIGGTLSAIVFYAPPVGTTVAPAAPTATTTAPTTTTTPAPTTSTAATSTPTVAASAPAN